MTNVDIIIGTLTVVAGVAFAMDKVRQFRRDKKREAAIAETETNQETHTLQSRAEADVSTSEPLSHGLRVPMKIISRVLTGAGYVWVGLNVLIYAAVIGFILMMIWIGKNYS